MLGTHFWSLASEEQFYLVWPFVVYYFSRRGRFVYLALALVVISPLLRIGAWRLLPSDQVTWIVYHAGIFQVGPLAIGAVIACGFIPRVKRAWLWALCLTIAIATFGAYKNNLQDSFGFSVEMKAHHQWLWAYSVIDLIAAALVISCIQDEGIVEFLEWRPLKKLGQVSYGFYLLHPFVAFAVLPLAKQYSIRYGFAAGIAILLTWILAELSFVLFESRFLLMKNRYFARAVTKPQLMVVADTA